MVVMPNKTKDVLSSGRDSAYDGQQRGGCASGAHGEGQLYRGHDRGREELRRKCRRQPFSLRTQEEPNRAHAFPLRDVE